MDDATDVQLNAALGNFKVPANDEGLIEGNAEIKPWSESSLPTGSHIRDDGVYVEETGPNESTRQVRISGPVWVDSFTRTDESDRWGAVVRWIDRDGRNHERAIPAGRFCERSPTLAQELADDGLFIVPSKQNKLINYLGDFANKRRALCVDRLGWTESRAGELVYVLPGKVTRKTDSADAERILFQPEQHAPTSATIHENGTLQDWQERIAKPCREHPMLVFGLCTALSAPLTKHSNLDGGGFHIYGTTSRGKTLLLQVAASTWGCGADPSNAGNLSYARRWNVTTNGLEGLAAAHNDGLICLDEIGTCTAKDFGSLVYSLAGGQGKTVLNQNRGLKPCRAWRITILSSGEISSRAKIEADGRTSKGGQELRLVDIPIPESSTLKAISNGRKIADNLKRDCGQFYGTAGPAFIQALVDNCTDAIELKNWLNDQMEKALNLLRVPELALAPEQERVLKRFALVLIAGYTAVEYAILPFEQSTILEAVKYVRDLWLEDNQGAATDAERGIESIRNFILKNEARFKLIRQPGETDDSASFDVENQPPIQHKAGYYNRDRGLWLFIPDVFREACGGHDPKVVARELRRRGLLFTNRSSGFQSGHKVPDQAGTVNFYAVSDAITDGGDN